MIKIWCVNDGQTHEVELGTPLSEISKNWCSSITDSKTKEVFPVLAAFVDHEIKPLDYKMHISHQVEFIGYNSPEGRATYIRSLRFVLQKAIRELYPDRILLVDHSLPSGTYCEILETSIGEDGRNLKYIPNGEDITLIRAKMKEIIAADHPFHVEKVLAEDAIKIYESQNQPSKAALLRSLGLFSCDLYSLDDVKDSFHGPLAPSTGYLKVFGIVGFNDGFCLQFPMLTDSGKVLPMEHQEKIAKALKEHSDWCCIAGVHGVGDLNKAINEGQAVKLINMAEARHERKYAEIANLIYERRGQVKIVFIAGPSSSGKTSSSLRLALQCEVLGMKPKVIELDNYFVDRDKTPLDENGEPDFESLYSMDLEFLNQQLNDLLAGKEVEIPKYDFKSGCRKFTGNKMRLGEKDILIMEGIHALDPKMTPSVDDSRIFRLFVSALTSLNLDENNSISTSDSRLLRRMVRDNRTRGLDPEKTIMMWHSVRRGEVRNIFPFQENADAVFNSALMFELPMLKYYAEPLLRRINPDSPAYTEARRLLKFLRYIVALKPEEIAAIPPTSIMREFIGGQTL